MIAVIGGYGVGMTMTLDRAPEAGETVGGGRLAIGPGGKGSNQAIGIARLGVPAALFTAIGDDATGDAALELWATAAVDAAAVVRLPGATMTGFILVDATGENRIAIADGALADVRPEALDAFDPVLDAAELLVVSLEIAPEVALEGIRRARARGVPVLLDPAPATADRDLIAAADVLTPNRGELAAIVADPDLEADVDAALDRLREWYPGRVVVTCGADGAVVDDDGRRTRVPSPRVDRVVDTTGAGDAFTAALAAELAEGADLVDAARFAAAAGACAVTVPEVVPALPTRDHVRRLLTAAGERMDG